MSLSIFSNAAIQQSDTSNNRLMLSLKISNYNTNSRIAIVAISGTESLSELYEFKVSFLCSDNAMDPAVVLGSYATIHFKSPSHNRFFHGVITEFSQGTTYPKEDIYLTEYFITLRPKVWLLSLDSDCRIFQNTSSIDIIRTILHDNNINDVSINTSQQREKSTSSDQSYCVQYNESSFNFISRLMEDSGTFYYFNHSENKHDLVITNNSHYEKLSSPINFAKYAHSDLQLGSVFNISKSSFVNVSGYSLGDYNYEISKTKLFNTLDTKQISKNKLFKSDSNRQVNTFYEYPGKFTNTNEGSQLSKIRAQEIECQHMIFKGESTVPEFSPGTIFELKGHNSNAFNDSYILYKVEHQIEINNHKGFVYKNKFIAIPKDTEFRPPRTTPKPKIYGNQTAVVVCPSGKEIYRNEHGAIKVHFHWDQNKNIKNVDDNSCWIRVAQMVSGSNWGALYIPRVGQEVVVSFLEGDPDRPLIVGCVYNDQFMPPYKNSEDNISTIKSVSFENPKGFNELRFDDKKDKEEFYIHAQRDMKIDIINSRTTTIDEDNDKLTIKKGSKFIDINAEGKEKGNFTFNMKKGDSKVTLQKGNSSVTLTDGNSDFTITKGNQSITLKNGNSTIKLQKGNASIEINGNCKINIKGSLNINATKDISIKSDSSISMEAKKNISIKSTMAAINVNARSMYTLNSTLIKMNGKTNVNVKSPLIVAGGGIVKLG